MSGDLRRRTGVKPPGTLRSWLFWIRDAIAIGTNHGFIVTSHFKCFRPPTHKCILVTISACWPPRRSSGISLEQRLEDYDNILGFLRCSTFHASCHARVQLYVDRQGIPAVTRWWHARPQ